MSSTRSTPARSGQVSVLVLACLILFIDGYDLFTLGTVGPSLAHYEPWGATSATIGVLGAATGLGMPIGSIFAGWSADRWGRRTPTAAVLTWISLSMLVAATAPGLGLFIAARFCTGVGLGALIPLMSAYVADRAPANRRTLHLAVTLGFVGFGGVTSALLGRLLLPDVHFQLLFLPGVLPILLLPVVWRLVPAGPAAGSAKAQTDGRGRVFQLVAPGVRRTTLLFWGASFLALALVFSSTAWLPTVLTSAGYDLGSAMEFSIAFTAGAVFGSVGLSLIADRGHLRTVTLSTFLLAAIAFFTLSTPQPRPLLLVAAALAGIGSLGCQGMVIACMSGFYPPHLRGTGIGIGLGVGRLGAVLGPLYLGVVTGVSDSHRAGFFAFIVMAILGAIVVVLLPRALARSDETIPAPTARAIAEKG